MSLKTQLSLPLIAFAAKHTLMTNITSQHKLLSCHLDSGCISNVIMVEGDYLVSKACSPGFNSEAGQIEMCFQRLAIEQHHFWLCRQVAMTRRCPLARYTLLRNLENFILLRRFLTTLFNSVFQIQIKLLYLFCVGSRTNIFD